MSSSIVHDTDASVRAMKRAADLVHSLDAVHALIFPNPADHVFSSPFVIHRVRCFLMPSFHEERRKELQKILWVRNEGIMF